MGKKVKKVKGFQMNRKTGHPSYAFYQKDTNVHSIGFTHNRDDRASKVELKHNIDPNDARECFAKTVVEIQKNTTYRRTQNTEEMRIHEEDRGIIAEIVKTNKKRR